MQHYSMYGIIKYTTTTKVKIKFNVTNADSDLKGLIKETEHK